MLIARTPVRISFGGGGTDLEAYYSRYGGCVVSTTIDKYFYIFLSVNKDDEIQISSSDYHTFYRHDSDQVLLVDGDLVLPKAVLNHFSIHKGLSMFLASEIPPGTGLGSSGSVAVAMVKAISIACGLNLSKEEIAELACHVEIDELGMPVGKQDQYAAAFGGLNFITFTSEGVGVEPVDVAPEIQRRLERNLLLFFTGSSRDSAKILKEQKRSSEKDEPRVIAALHAVKEMTLEVKACFQRGDLRRFGELLNLNWQHKKRFASGISTPLIDDFYALALASGAIGGKITGAGGGGFLMLYCELEHQARVTRALEAKGLRRMNFRFETDGARILLNAGLRLR